MPDLLTRGQANELLDDAQRRLDLHTQLITGTCAACGHFDCIERELAMREFVEIQLGRLPRRAPGASQPHLCDRGGWSAWLIPVTRPN